MTRWLITGGSGQLGTHLTRLLAGQDVISTTRHELDITDAAAVEAAVDRCQPDVVLNAAAYTAVDAAEADEAAADAVNHLAVRNLATALAATGGRLVHVSTDYVFAGDSREPYDVDAPTGPTTAYGRTKLGGERAALDLLPGRVHIVRTAWVYGGPGPNFVDTMRRLADEQRTVDVVADQTGSPTYVLDLARALVELGSRKDVAAPVLHYVNAGTATWYDLAREVFRLHGADPDRVCPTDSASFPRPARRPAWSVLSTRAWTGAGLSAPRSWQAALADAMATAADTGRTEE